MTYNFGRKDTFGIKWFFSNDKKSGFFFKTLIQYPNPFVKTDNRTVVSITLYMMLDYFGSGIGLTTDR